MVGFPFNLFCYNIPETSDNVLDDDELLRGFTQLSDTSQGRFLTCILGLLGAVSVLTQIRFVSSLVINSNAQGAFRQRKAPCANCTVHIPIFEVRKTGLLSLLLFILFSRA